MAASRSDGKGVFVGAFFGSMPLRANFAHLRAILRALFSETSECGPMARVVLRSVSALPCPMMVSDWMNRFETPLFLRGSIINFRPRPPLLSP